MADKRLFAIIAFSVSAVLLFAAPTELRVKGDRVNLRVRPIGDSEVAGQVSTGDVLIAPEGLESGAEWVRVRPPVSVDVWIFASLLTGDEVNASDCLVRCGPGLNYKFVGKLDKGDKIVKRGNRVGDWQPIAPIADKCELFISADYVEILPPAVKVEGGDNLELRDKSLEVQTAVVKAEGEVRNAELSTATAKASDPVPPPAPITAAKPEPPVSAPAETSKLRNLETSKPPVAAVATTRDPPVATPAVTAAGDGAPAIPAPSAEGEVRNAELSTATAKTLEPVQASVAAVAQEHDSPGAKPQPQSQPFNLSTLQPFNPPTSNLVPETSKLPNLQTSKPPKLPPELSNLALDKFQPQGMQVVYSGRLEKIPSMRAAGSTRYQLVAKTGVMKSAVICSLTGLTGQWRELLDSDLEVTGHLWYLSGDPVPVLQASRVIRVASWEE